MRVEVSRPAPAMAFKRRNHLLDLSSGPFEGRRVVISESHDSPERCDALIVAGVAAEMSGGAFEPKSYGNLSCRVDNLGLGLVGSHWMRHSFAEIPYAATGLKRDGQESGCHESDRQAPRDGANPVEGVHSCFQW